MKIAEAPASAWGYNEGRWISQRFNRSLLGCSLDFPSATGHLPPRVLLPEEYRKKLKETGDRDLVSESWAMVPQLERIQLIQAKQ